MMTNTNQLKKLLLSTAKNVGIDLTTDMLDKFIAYKTMLIDHNQNVNLTAIEDPQEIILKHFVDSIAPIAIAGEYMQGSIIDVGSGAGFPGLPVAIAMPSASVTLLEPIQKRTNFLALVSEATEQTNVTILNGRSEDIAHDPALRQTFDTAVSRAVAPLHKLCELCLPFAKVGGHFVAYKAGDTDQETQEAIKAINLLGGELINTINYTLPTTDISRSLIIIRKISQTPSQYPRKPNKIKNSPII